MEYILKKIGISDNTLAYVVEYLRIKISYIIKSMTKEELLKMKGEAGSLLKVVDCKFLEHSRRVSHGIEK